MTRALLRLLGVCVTAVSAAAAAAPADGVAQFQLDNGLKVLVRPDHRAPVVVSQLWYGVGSVDEHRGITGVSHVLEHMMFKGTDELAPGEFSETIARHGGDDNAFTSQDYTGYYQQIAAEHLELALRLEADRMTDLRLDPREFERELGVVQEERAQRVEDNPRALTHERLRAAAFPSSPARNPVIGWPADLSSMRLQEVERWYRAWYAPNNAALVVVGDVEPDRVRALAQRHFAAKERAELPPRPAPAEVAPRGEARLKVHAPAKLPYLAMGWRVPSLATIDDARDAYALDVLVGILDGGRSARFASELVRGRSIAASAGAGYSMLARADALLSVQGTPARGHTVAELESALREQIERLKQGGIERAELERVKTNVRASEVFQRDSMFYQAMRIGMLEITGLGQDAYAAYREGIDAVTADDIQRVARQYLTDQRLTVAELVPTGVGDGTAPGESQPAEGGTPQGDTDGQ